MSTHSHALTLWVPGLADYFAQQPQALKSLKRSAWQTLLAKSDRLSATQDDFYHRGSYLFHQPCTLPIAATMVAAQIDTATEGDFWIRAEPTQMIPDRDALVLMPPESLAMNEAESQALFECFNQHFEQDRVQLEWGSDRDWYCRLPQAIDLSTTPLADAVGHNVNQLYPKGSAARYWHQLINETQMLFYTHPVNEARREKGLAEINSLWFWGEGQTLSSQRVEREGVTLWSDDLYLKGMAKLTQAQSQTAVKNAQAWLNLLENQASQQHLIHLDLFTPSDTMETPSSRVASLEADWFEPLLQSLQQQKIHSLLLDFGGANRYHLNPKHLKRFWRFNQSLVGRL